MSGSQPADGSLPLSGRSIVVCRATDQGSPLRLALAELGATVIALPLIEVTEPSDQAPLAAAVASLASYDWVAFTSSNAVDAVARVLATSPWPASTRIASVGQATSAAIEAAGWTVHFEPSVATAATLAAELDMEPGQTLLAPLAELASQELESELERRGVTVHRLEAYRTTTPEHGPDVLAAARLSDVVVLTSPSIVDRWIEAIGAEQAQTIATVSIGPVTAQRITDRGLAPSAVAEPHSTSGLIATTVEFFHISEQT